ncbi:MAG: hypothetical protein HY555_03205 [Euryarchaeota archaeon]|nr:hypothetical protein [Euryarchaeota archaeon]
MRSEILFVLLIAFAALPVVEAAEVDVTLTDHDIFVTFDKPKGSVESFDYNTTLRIINPKNVTESINGLTATTNINGITTSLSTTFLAVGGGSGERVDLIFHISSNLSEGFYEGWLKVTSADAKADNLLPITVNVKHPPATLNATWDVAAWGKVKAGSSFARKVTVKEVMGYKSAGNVSVLITAFGPAILAFSGRLGDISPFGTKEVAVNVEVPARFLRPGVYTVKTAFDTTSPAALSITEASYEIPTPVVSLDKTTLDFGKVTFETGKDTAQAFLAVSETGGFTPVEGIKVVLVTGEEGWISFPQQEYVPAGGSVSYPFRLFLPPDASLGEKRFRLSVSAEYAGTNFVEAGVLVYFPGVDDAIKFLKNATPVENLTASAAVINSSVALLENARGITELRKISNVMAVYSGSRTLFSNLQGALTVKTPDRLFEADAAIRAREALNRMKIGDQNLADPILKVHSSEAVKAAEAMWGSFSLGLLNDLVGLAEGERETNYRAAVNHYKRIKQLYASMGDAKRAEEFSKRQKEMEGRYEEAVIKATNAKLEGEEELSSARQQAWAFRGSYFVLNPFSYEFVAANYDSAVRKFAEAEALFKNAGEENEADLLLTRGGDLKAQRTAIHRAFLAYASLLAFFSLWLVGRVTLGLYRFREDEVSIQLGELVMEKVDKKAKTD